MTDKNDTLKNDSEDSFEKSLKSLGYLFPSTEDEVEAFEKNNEIEQIPENFSTASELLLRSKYSSVSKKINISTNKSSENLARAARKGSDISEDIIKKMKSDRDEAENGKE
jgi:hypothetical protein